MNFFDDLFDISDDSNYSVTGLTKELNSIYIYDVFKKKKKSIIVLCNSLFEANDIYNRMLSYTNKVLLFPMDDFITSEAIAISPEFKTERVNTLNKIVTDDNYIVITNLMGILRYLPSLDIYKNSIISLKSGIDIEREKFISDLIDLGYERNSVVSQTGEFAIRGYVIDVFPIGFDNPIRIELWGDTIDSIKFFDVDSQLSNDLIEDVKIYPFTEFLLSNSSADVIKKQKYLPYYTKDVQGLWDYLPKACLFYYDYNQIVSSYEHLRETILSYDEEVNDSIKTNYMWDILDIRVTDLVYMMDIDSLPLKKLKKYSFISHNIDNYQGHFEKIKLDLSNYLQKGKTVILAIDNKNVAKRIISYLEIENIILTDESNIIEKMINLVNKSLVSGFIYENYVVLSENDLFGKKEIKRNVKNKFKIGTKINSLDNLEKGDYVVHVDHGIGIYSELCTLTKNGLKKDYIKLIYADGDSLYVPASKIEKISKFTGKEGTTLKLDKLGTDAWQRKKERIRKRLANIAGDLLKVSAERESTKGFAFSLDDENQMIFENEFKYEATSDQIRAIEMIKREMEKDKPMDMLLCGDVGYGKTEVAFRAIFKAVNNGKQVAYLCPTTILSSQQYNSALERFSSFPVNIALLNRFTSSSEEKKIMEKLKAGKIDILFGTHKILNNKITFKDLGLLVIDEEQRFGVTHKEKIKQYKANIDVLTLSATPIPRTLQMSMSGIRSLSLIETPPEKRHPVQTYVIPENKNIIKDAIYKELSRKGQVFILYNNINKIENKLKEISELVPEARITYAHGQMNKIVLENKMQDFIDYEYDILLCTTIIETGIDIPNVNTLIILDADYFGLSQLYQIRGRVGRSDKIGYAYLMYNGKKNLSDTATLRLNTIKEFTELGSGFRIAKRDLSIRGAGDILGSEQSGFIDSIGIDLYLKMLKEEVDKLKGIDVLEDDASNKPLIDVDTHISSDYIDDEDLKIEIHKKINDVNSIESINLIKDELENRFGKINDKIIIYMYEEWFEKMAKQLGIVSVNQDKNSITLVMPLEVSKHLDGEKLFFMAYEISDRFKFSYNNEKIYIILNIIKLDKHFIFYLDELLAKIIEMISD